MLDGKVNVFFPDENSRFAQYTLREPERRTAAYPPICDTLEQRFAGQFHLSISGGGDDKEYRRDWVH